MNIYPISIVVYPLMGAWRAECKTCGAYANSDGSKYKHPIVEALDNLSKAPTTFSDKSKGCSHHYGSYKSRVNCYVYSKDVNSIPQPRNISYEYVFNNISKRYEPDFDAIASGKGCAKSICVAHKYQLEVYNPTSSKQSCTGAKKEENKNG